MKQLPVRSLLVILLLVLVSSYQPKKVNSVPSTNVKDTLSSSQLSFFANLAAGNSATDTLLLIETSGNPSNTTNNLFVGDTLAIGTSGTTPLTNYVVSDIGNTAQFQITSGIGATNAFAGSVVIATRSAIHTISFTPQSNIIAGAWQFLIKATSRAGEDENDGIPDQQGFDLGQDIGSTNTGSGTRLKAADVACPFGASASVGTTAIISSNSYHIIKCDLGVGITNPIGVGATITIGRALATGSQLINPAPALSHTEGQADSSADVYSFFLQHLDADDAIVSADTSAGRIAVVESVRVTATIDPTITFTIDTTNTTSGQTRCGNVLGSAADNTTAVSAAFGSLSLGAFNDLAHRLSSVTNANNGYAVTVYEIDQMKEISSGTTIPDTDCDGEDCTTTSATEWTTEFDESGWGYSLENISVGVSIFEYDEGATFQAKAFAKGASNAQEIMSNTSTPIATEVAYICYRLAISPIQEAGNYENQLVYTATATF